MAETLTDTSVAEIEAWLDRNRNREQPSQRTSVATHMAWIPDEWSRAAEGVMRGLGDRVPSRTLLLHPEPDAKGDGFDATITVDRFPGERSGVSVEIVRIRLRGSAAEAPASVVTPLLLADLPVFLRWRGRPTFGRKPYEDLVGVADRLIVDSTEWDRLPSGLAKLSESFGRIAVSDLAWARTLPWRASIAALWPGIKEAKTLRVVGPRPEALLLRAWLQVRLRRRVRLSHEDGRKLTRVEVDGEPVAPARGLPCTPSDLLSAELESFARDRVYEAVVRAV
jgi:Glucose-6-phosphate dehydrogenase subunit N-terminal domain/Glucose-6-phosphate dehydrogenase subunit C-terminal domain